MAHVAGRVCVGEHGEGANGVGGRCGKGLRDNGGGKDAKNEGVARKETC